MTNAGFAPWLITSLRERNGNPQKLSPKGGQCHKGYFCSTTSEKYSQSQWTHLLALGIWPRNGCRRFPLIRRQLRWHLVKIITQVALSYVLVSKLDFVVSDRTVGRRMTCGWLDLLGIWYRQGMVAPLAFEQWPFLPALWTGWVTLRLTPVRGSIVGAFESQRVTMRPEVMNAALRLIKMLQLFLRHSHSGECNFWKRRHCIFRYVSFYCVL